MPPTNKAAWLTVPYAPFEVKDAPYTPPGPNQLVVKNHFVAANPLDWAKHYIGDKRWPHLDIPPGDRIIAHALGFYDFGQGQPEAAFQRYTLARDYMTTPIPDSLPFDKAVVIPLSCSAAASALFQKPFLALDHPTVPARSSNGSVLIVTGDATAVGSNAIQLARYAGYTLATTCSPRNFDLMKKLGASPDLIFDYSDPSYEGSLAAALKGKKVAGAFALGTGAIEVCIRILGGLDPVLATKIVVKASFP
ncbi:hypothetical protein K490DRAFT_59981 [Saccharata proteae CBS 121410]|uniref:GroES-like protein n=1 Tax=Saccharata proteae CBS 121410 TaxID=1314787 RepID=A0A9P4LUD3_9PEZI|nr:hypothetical protein K490DRAFT_59981 [Saccharata proteae CBS 121410]